jgi:hypothetical protein
VGSAPFAERALSARAADHPSCKRRARTCRIEKSAYCAKNWPLVYDACFDDMRHCCKLIRKCKIGAYYSCLATQTW